MTTYTPKPEDIQREWFVVDAQDKILGRLATEIARRLRGKHKPEYTPHLDNGAFVIVVNAKNIRVTGNKLEDKVYYRHSHYPGGIKGTALKDMLAAKPERVIMHAVRGMLPKNRLGRALLRKIKVYAGPTHPHAAQKPQALAL